MDPGWRTERWGWRCDGEAHTPPSWTGVRAGNTCHSIHKEAGWTGRQYHLDRNKEVYRAELYVLHQAIQIFADSAFAIDRIASDRIGPGQRLAVEAIEACSRLMSRGNSITV